MEKELAKLDTYLREKRPEYYRALQKPLSEADIAGLERTGLRLGDNV